MAGSGAHGEGISIRLSRLALRVADGVALTMGHVGSRIAMATVADASALPATPSVRPNASTAQVGIAIRAIVAC